MWEELVIHLALGILTQVVKNPAKALALKTYLLQLRDAINAAYPGL